jgi:HAMP domain-containing protein
MLNNFTIAKKVNFLLLLTLIIGLTMSGIVLSNILRQKIETETTSKAELLLSTMLSVRDYTTEQINPLLAPQLISVTNFLPQTVPSFSAHKVFAKLKENPNYANFSYKEAAINPTNLKDKADGFETQLVTNFRADNTKQRITGYISSPVKSFYIAKPIQIKKSSCLVCHSVPQAAPASMINSYGKENGFGWKLNEIIGTQVIYVPSEELVHENFTSLLLVLMTILAAFSIALFAINTLISKTIVRPLNRMIKVANEVSQGNMNVEFPSVNSKDEIGNLSKSFIRMKHSLQLSIDMLKKD